MTEEPPFGELGHFLQERLLIIPHSGMLQLESHRPYGIMARGVQFDPSGILDHRG